MDSEVCIALMATAHWAGNVNYSGTNLINVLLTVFLLIKKNT